MIYCGVNNKRITKSALKDAGVRIVGRGRGYLKAVRPDGLKIFLDGDRALDAVRVRAKDPRLVILAVSFRRAQQIAIGYCRKHAPDLLTDIMKAVDYTDPNSKTLLQVGILNGAKGCLRPVNLRGSR